MKKLNVLLVSGLMCAVIGLSAQTELKEGMIKMEITEVSSDNEQVAAQLEMMKGTQTQYYFTNEKSLVSANMMGGMIKMQSLVNNADEHLTFLFDAMGQKMMVKSTKEERAAMEAEQAEAMEGIKVVYDESQTKDILGHKCVKATIEGGADFPMNFHMWVATDIKASNKLIQGLQGFEIKGFPLEFVMDMEQMSMTYSTVELDKKVDKEVFNVNTSGYQEMTFEEFQQQMGAFGGGMGF
jgi:hypothetical protein